MEKPIIEIPQEVKIVKNIIHNLLKTKKILRMYPPNNPVCRKVAQETFNNLDNFLIYKEIKLTIQRNQILYHGESVYISEDKEDNLAFFFFKDGVRELTFEKGFDENELVKFIRILIIDFQNYMIDDDVVTLMWQSDFKHLKYVVDENVIFDYDENIEKMVTASSETDEDKDESNLIQAFNDALRQEHNTPKEIVPLDDKDMQIISAELKHEGKNVINKLIIILYDLLLKANDMLLFSEIVGFLCETILYCLKNGDFRCTLSILHAINFIEKKRTIKEEKMVILKRIFNIINEDEYIKVIGQVLESETPVDTKACVTFMKYLDTPAIPYLLYVLSTMETELSRSIITKTLAYLGKKDIKALASGLNNPSWHVVRGVISIFEATQDKTAIEYLKEVLNHKDIRVRRESVKAIGNIGGLESIDILKGVLSDIERPIRLAAVDALGKIGGETAMEVIFQEILKKDFLAKDFIEKKKFYTVLARFNHNKIVDYFMKTAKKAKFFGSEKIDETRACAAYALGLLRIKKAVPILNKLTRVSCDVLRNESSIAIQKILEQKETYDGKIYK